jgi:serine/threonine-protein kinase RsbW
MAERELIVLALHKNIEKICNSAGEAAEEAGFNDKTVYACQLAVGEACENVINHGYQGEGKGEIILTTRVSPGNIVIELSDTAPPFNPAVSPENSEWAHEDPPIGGLGLLIIHRVMDKVKYRREGDRNFLELHKTLPLR